MDSKKQEPYEDHEDEHEDRKNQATYPYSEPIHDSTGKENIKTKCNVGFSDIFVSLELLVSLNRIYYFFY